MPHIFENPFTPESAKPRKRLFGVEEVKLREIPARFRKVKYGTMEILESQVKFLEEVEDKLEKMVNEGIAKGYIKKTGGPPDKTTKKEIRDMVLEGIAIKADEKGNIKEIEWGNLGNLWNLEIEVLPALDELKELEILDCSYNKLKRLPDLSKLKKLKRLDCHSNQIKELPELGNLLQLENLNCSKNELEELPGLSKLKKLKILDCSQNKLTQLPDLAGLEELDTINCLDNPKLNKIPNLGGQSKNLFINFNGTSIPKKELEKLQKKYPNIYYK